SRGSGAVSDAPHRLTRRMTGASGRGPSRQPADANEALRQFRFSAAPAATGPPGAGGLRSLALGELLDLGLRHRVQTLQQMPYHPLARAVRQDRLRGGASVRDVGDPVVEPGRAPPRDREPALRHPPPSFDLCQGLATQFHEGPPRVSSRRHGVTLTPMAHARESGRPASRLCSLARSLGAPRTLAPSRASGAINLTPSTAARCRIASFGHRDPEAASDRAVLPFGNPVDMWIRRCATDAARRRPAGTHARIRRIAPPWSR